MEIVINNKNSIGHNETKIKNLGDIIRISSAQLFDASDGEDWDYVGVDLPVSMYVQAVNNILKGKDSDLKSDDKYLKMIFKGSRIYVEAGKATGTLSQYNEHVGAHEFITKFPKLIEKYMN